MEFHELANIYPLSTTDAAFENLAQDISERGLEHPISTYQGKILDGRRRHLACLKAGVEPQYEDYTGDNPLRFVISENSMRRELNESQKAMVGARMKPYFEQEAKKRQGTRTDISADLRGSLGHKTSEEISKMVNSSARLVENAIKVLAKGTPELVLQVESGAMRLDEAIKICDAPPEEQTKLLALPKPDRKQELKNRKEQKKKAAKIEKSAAPEVAEAENVSDNQGQTPAEGKNPTARLEPAEQIVQESIPAGGSTVAPQMSPLENFERLSKVLIAIIKGAEAGGWVSLPRSIASDLVKKLMPFVEEAMEQPSLSEDRDAQTAGDESSAAHPALDQKTEVSTDESEETPPAETSNILEGDFRKRRTRKTNGSSPDAPASTVDKAEGTEEAPEGAEISSTHPSLALESEVATDISEEDRPKETPKVEKGGSAKRKRAKVGQGSLPCYLNGPYLKGHPEYRGCSDGCKHLDECCKADAQRRAAKRDEACTPAKGEKEQNCLESDLSEHIEAA